MEVITSLSNDIVKNTVKLHQKKYRENLLILEGKKSVEEAFEYNLKIEYIMSDDENILLKFDAEKKYLVNSKVMEKISTTTSPTTVLAVVQKPKYSKADFKNFNRIALFDGIKDAGNLGTVIRASVAFKIDGIILFGDCTDEFSPKTIRAAASNMFKIPVVNFDFNDLKELKKTHEFIATVVDNGESVTDIKIAPKSIVMFGSEADGLCEELLQMSDTKATIEMKDAVESLNLALSTGIILWELSKK